MQHYELIKNADNTFRAEKIAGELVKMEDGTFGQLINGEVVANLQPQDIVILNQENNG